MASPTGDRLGLDLSDRPYFRSARDGTERVWSEAIPGVDTGMLTVVHGRPVRAVNGEVLGYLVAAFYAATLSERLASGLPADSTISLIDQRGLVLYSSNPDVALGTDISDTPSVQEALAGRLVRLESEEIITPGDTQFGALVPVAESGWVVAFTRPQAPLEADLRAQWLFQSAATTAVMGIAAVILVLVTRRILQPLTLLASAAGEIARGRRPAIPDAKGSRETRELTTAMQSMSAAVNRREDDLRQLARQQSVVSELGRLALTGTSVQELFDRSVSAVAETLTVEYVKVLELAPDGHICTCVRAWAGRKAMSARRRSPPIGRRRRAIHSLPERP